MIQVIIGNGKGKTTSAIGGLMRAHGSGMKCLFAQFLKGRETGELASVTALGIPVLRTEEVKKFIPYMDESELTACRKDVLDVFDRAETEGCNYDYIVLDEVLDAIELEMLSQKRVLDFILKAKAEIILTGRKAGKDIENTADYISLIQEVKHPYTRGVQARRGIEY